MKKLETKQIVMIALMAVLALLVLRRYLPMLELPTDGKIEEAELQLKSRVSDLAVQRKVNDDWLLELDRIRGKASIFWVRKRLGVPVEQEVLEEFNNIARLASVNIQNKEPHLVKVPNSNYVQEVELRIEMRGASMKEFTRLLKEIRRSRRKLYWTSCRIDPDNVQKPTGIRVAARLKAYVLSDECSRILSTGISVDEKETTKGKRNAASNKGGKKAVRLPAGNGAANRGGQKK